MCITGLKVMNLNFCGFILKKIEEQSWFACKEVANSPVGSGLGLGRVSLTNWKYRVGFESVCLSLKHMSGWVQVGFTFPKTRFSSC